MWLKIILLLNQMTLICMYKKVCTEKCSQIIPIKKSSLRTMKASSFDSFWSYFHFVKKLNMKYEMNKLHLHLQALLGILFINLYVNFLSIFLSNIHYIWMQVNFIKSNLATNLDDLPVLWFSKWTKRIGCLTSTSMLTVRNPAPFFVFFS